MKKTAIMLVLFLLLISVSACRTNESWSPADQKQADYLFDNKDYDKAFKSYMILAKNGDPYSQERVGMMYNDGLGTHVDYDQSLLWLEKAANGGQVHAMSLVGSFYTNGKTRDVNCTKGIRWLKAAIENNSSYSMFMLSMLYKTGICVEMNEKKSGSLIVMASKYDDRYGTLCNGLRHYEGINTKKDYSKALKAFKRSIEKRNPVGPYYLSQMYRYGHGVQLNLKKSFDLLLEASRLGLPHADYSLAVMYYKGVYVDQNFSKSYFYAKKSSYVVPGSALLVGFLYESGRGVPQDIDKAKQWYRKAAGMGSAEAKERLEALQ